MSNSIFNIYLNTYLITSFALSSLFITYREVKADLIMEASSVALQGEVVLIFNL